MILKPEVVLVCRPKIFLLLALRIEESFLRLFIPECRVCESYFFSVLLIIWPDNWKKCSKDAKIMFLVVQ